MLKWQEINRLNKVAPLLPGGGIETAKSPKIYENLFSGKGLFFYETRQKIFSLLGGKIEFEFWQCWAVGPIQI